MTTYDNYYFDVKVGHCEFMSFVNDVNDYGYLGCLFYFRIKEKEKDIFYINFYFVMSLFFKNFISHYFN